MSKRRNPTNPKKGTAKAAVIGRQREELAVALRLEGWTLSAIAKKVGFADHAGARVAILRAMDRMPSPANLEEIRKREFNKLEEIEREALEQWKRSTEDAMTRTEAETKDGVMVTEKAEGQSGNPALLDKVLKAMERRAKLLGLDAPQKIELGDAPRVIQQDPADIFEAAAKRAKKQKANDSSD